MQANTWLAARASLALLLMASFYLLAFGVAAGLLAFAYVAFLKIRILKIVVVCVGGAGTILWSLLPRRDRFVAPGPEMTDASEPRLFDMLRGVASATDQRMPAEVYLLADVNAWVAQRGGLLGVGSRRIMGLGLPLLQSVSVQELRAILAHEFGHYHSGDVALGPWIHRTRAAMGRTIAQLSGSVLQTVFVAYGNVFLRVTHAISRRQEYIADELAARVAGGGPLASALRKVEAAAPAFTAYWQSEVTPVLGSGYLPPIMSGFAQFVSVKGVADGMKAHVAAREVDAASDPFDTHPSLKERVAALSRLPQGTRGDDQAASTLLSSVDVWEKRLLGAIFGVAEIDALKPLAWPAVIAQVYVPAWRKLVAENRKVVDGLTVGGLPVRRSGLIVRGRGDIMGEERVVHARQVIVIALALRLIDAGWGGETAPGDKVVLRSGEGATLSLVDLEQLVNGDVETLPMGLAPELPLVGPAP